MKCNLHLSQRMARVWAAFDIGSGAVKLTVAQMAGQALEKILYAKQRSVLVAHAVKQSPDNRIEDEITDALANAIRSLQQEAAEASNTPMEEMTSAAIATAVYRESTNGPQVIRDLTDRLGLPITIIPQRLEGYLGYLTAKQSLAHHSPQSPTEGLVSWDIGGASFQLAGFPHGSDDDPEKMCVVEGPLGSSKVTSMIVEEVQHKSFLTTQSVNPLSQKDAQLARQKLRNMLQTTQEAASWLTPPLRKNVTVIGGDTSSARVGFLVTGDHLIQREQLDSAITQWFDKTDQEIEAHGFLEPGMVVSKLLLLSEAMHFFQFDSIRYVPSNGSAEGLFLYSPLWNESASRTEMEQSA